MLDRLQSLFDRQTYGTQAELEALVEFVLFVEFADHHVHELEHEQLARELESLPWQGVRPASAWAQTAVARVRRAMEAGAEAVDEALDDVAGRLENDDMRRGVTLACERMAAADGVTNDAERAMLARIAAHVKAR